MSILELSGSGSGSIHHPIDDVNLLLLSFLQYMMLPFCFGSFLLLICTQNDRDLGIIRQRYKLFKQNQNEMSE